MKRIMFYEPAMCCPTGLCGVSVNPELLRISTICNNLMKNGFEVTRYNLSSAPNAFIKNKEVQQLVKQYGIKILPITTVDGNIIKTSSYPSNQELKEYLGITDDYLC